MAVLLDDLRTFEGMRAELEANHGMAWVVIHKGVFEGVFPDFDAAASYAVDRFTAEPCLIRQVGAPTAIQLPGGMVFTPAHALRAGGV